MEEGKTVINRMQRKIFMVTQSIDTNPEVERILISLLRKMSISMKFNQIQSFTASMIKLSRRAISRANPNLSEQEKGILFVKYHYGNEMADRLQTFLKQSNL